MGLIVKKFPFKLEKEQITKVAKMDTGQKSVGVVVVLEGRWG